MKFQYSEKKVRLPGNVHAYAEKKVMKLARFFEEDAEALIVFSVEKNQNNVELTVHGAGTWFRASESTSDMFASIDAAVSTIEGQIRKNKTRLARRLRQDAQARAAVQSSAGILRDLARRCAQVGTAASRPAAPAASAVGQQPLAAPLGGQAR